MFHKSGQVKIPEDITLGGINDLRDPCRLPWICNYLVHLLYQKLIITRIFDISLDARKDLRRIPHDQTAEILGEDFHVVWINQLIEWIRR